MNTTAKRMAIMLVAVGVVTASVPDSLRCINSACTV